MMPSRYTSSMSRDDAAQQANLLGVRYDEQYRLELLSASRFADLSAIPRAYV